MCRKNTKRKNPNIIKTDNRRMMLLSDSVVFGNKNSRFIKEQEDSRI